MNITNQQASSNVPRPFPLDFTPLRRHIVLSPYLSPYICEIPDWQIWQQQTGLYPLLTKSVMDVLLPAMFNSSLPYRLSRMRALAIDCILLGFFALGVAASAQQPPPGELVRTAIQNEMNDNSHLHLFSWKEHDISREKGDRIVYVVDTPEGTLSRVLLINGKPLTPEQRKAEDERERKLLDPSQMRRQHKEQLEDEERTHKMLAAIPDAFEFTYLGSSVAPNGHTLVRLKFTPRPNYNPPSREIAVFTGMHGEMAIDETAHRLVKVDGKLFKDVDFGWGILGRLYKGGRFYVEESEITPSHWDTTKMLLHFDGKVLLFKPIHIDDNQIDWDFQPVPPMSVEQALNFLSRDQTAQNARLAP